MQSLRKYLAEASYKSALLVQQELIDLLPMEYDVEMGSTQLTSDYKACHLNVSKDGSSRQLNIRWNGDDMHRFQAFRTYETQYGMMPRATSVEMLAKMIIDELEEE